MKNILLPLVLLTALVSSGQDTKTAETKDSKSEKGKRKFHVHSFEFTMAPSADYFIYSKGKISHNPDPYEDLMPFVGFNIGGQYIFRPIHLISVSAGLNYRMQGYFTQEKTASGNDFFISSRRYGHTAYLTIPVYAHLYKRMKKCSFEFATGPEFYIPLYSTTFAKAYDALGDITSSNSGVGKLSTSTMQQNASFGWSVYLGGELDISESADMFVGPQILFLDLARLNKNNQLQRTDNGGFYNVSLGLKLGFRFHKKS